ncbi:MAG: DHH family phosphoesterase, partial [bacterium]|nr:DHH family phosphoesterase [bacterium]
MANYIQSGMILERLKESKNILLNCHVGPDLDSIGSATAMYEVLKGWKKKVTIICPSIIPEKFKLLNHCSEINTVDFSKFDFSTFDLFLVLDTSSDNRITGSKEINLPKNLERIVIDHHITNEYKGEVNILDVNASATTEILFRVFQDWNITITPDMATALYSGMAGDTVFFKYLINPRKLFSIMTELL